jgi:hypothetical protein
MRYDTVPDVQTAYNEARQVHCNLHNRKVWTKVKWTSGGVQLCDRCYRISRQSSPTELQKGTR